MRQRYVCVDVQCDRGPNCKAPILHERGANEGAETSGVGATVIEAKRDAYSTGWKRVRGKDICPYCDAKDRTLPDPPAGETT